MKDKIDVGAALHSYVLADAFRMVEPKNSLVDTIR